MARGDYMKRRRKFPKKHIPESKWAEATIDGVWQILRLTPEEAAALNRLPKNHGPVIRIYRMYRAKYETLK